MQDIYNRLWETRDKTEFNDSFIFVNAPIFLGVNCKTKTSIFGGKFAENMSTLELVFCPEISRTINLKYAIENKRKRRAQCMF